IGPVHNWHRFTLRAAEEEFDDNRLPRYTSGEELGYRGLATQIEQLAPFANFILEHCFDEPKSKDNRLPRVNAKDSSLFAIDKSLEANWTTPVITLWLRSANRYMNCRFTFCAASHQL